MNYKEYILDEYQQKIIKERSLLNFDQELKKKNRGKKGFSIIFRKELDILIHQFYRDGIQFYGFTINLSFLDCKDPLLWSKVHQEVEILISEIGTNLELAEFCYISIELHKTKKRVIKLSKGKIEEKSLQLYFEGLPRLHGVIGVRSILGDNDFLDISVKKLFRSYFSYQDIKIIRLKKIKNVKKYWNYCIKENNFKFHRMTQYSHSSHYQEIYGTIADLELIYDEGQGGFAFSLDEWAQSVTKNIIGVKILNPTNKTLITYLLNLFLMHLDCTVNENKIYQKIPNTKYSWKMINNIKVLKDNNVLVFEYLKKIYPQQLEGINTMEIINKDWNKTMDDILGNKNRYFPLIEFNKNAIEFMDGIFFINEKKFYDFESKISEIKEKMQNNSCCTYFAVGFKRVKKKLVS